MAWTATAGDVYLRPEGGTAVEIDFSNGDMTIRKEYILNSEADIGPKALEIEAMLNDLTAKESLASTVRTNFIGKKYGLDGNGKLIELIP